MWLTVVLIILFILLTNYRYKWIYIIAKTYKRDLRGFVLTRIVKEIVADTKRSNLTVHKKFARILDQRPDKVAIYFEDDTWTYEQFEHFSNKIANFFIKEGYEKGDIVALFYENRPEFIGIWLGLSKLGIPIALVNTNQSGDSLIHSLKICNTKALIFGSTFALTVQGILDRIKGISVYQFDDTIKVEKIIKGSVNLTQELQLIENHSVKIKEDLHYRDPLFYIFTSGTTGLPKAAIVTQAKFLVLVGVMTFACNENDILYDPLPLYHTVGTIGTGFSIMYGASCVIRKKFSASHYFLDCAKYKCTRGQYVGEMCRYIVNAAPEGSINHGIEKMIGNGLRKEVWIDLVKKFRIKHVYEYYGATEGNLILANLDNTIGSIGFIPRYMRQRHNAQIVKYDEQTEQPVRNEKGRCIVCDINETGLLIAKIDPRMITRTFQGYSDQEQTKSKILLNVLELGDKYFNTGDLVKMNELGNIYFKDRIGDTFRWKSENVSTLEVEKVLNNFLHNSDSVVFGVQVPGTEGKAGMAVIVDPNNEIDVNLLSECVRTHLPTYAIPLFLRIAPSISVTGTFKLRKVELKLEGYNLNIIHDDLYFFDHTVQQYIRLTTKLYEDIQHSRIRI